MNRKDECTMNIRNDNEPYDDNKERMEHDYESDEVKQNANGNGQDSEQTNQQPNQMDYQESNQTSSQENKPSYPEGNGSVESQYHQSNQSNHHIEQNSSN